ncbi:hypothetical protein KAR91_44445 [Candidatus Pacearchaeota archaeon]|nr:hypothetical protein [Candidatus Pacearchaeota archaeon]
MTLPKSEVSKAVEAASYDNFRVFTYFIFSASFDNFKTGNHVARMCDLLQRNPWTMRVSARDHFKSTSFYDLLMWKIWRLKKYPHDEEWKYFSYKKGMAAYHLSEEPGKLKYLIQNNIFFNDIIDLKPTAEFIHKYTWDDNKFISIAPSGLRSFARGTHCHGVIIDDPFQDPENKMKLTDIYKINDKIKSNVIDMPHEEGELHIAGTAQTTEDFFFDEIFQSEFIFKNQPVMKTTPCSVEQCLKKFKDLDKIDCLSCSNYKVKSGQVLWPEHQPYVRIMKKRRLQGERINNQEYFCSPSYAEDAFFLMAQLKPVIGELSGNGYPVDTKRPTDNDVSAYLDIGKKQHPSHLSVFEKAGKKAIMLHQKFMDGWDYIRQIDYCNRAIENFEISWFEFDNTRGEFEVFIEQHKLPKPMHPCVHTIKKKGQMSGAFNERVENKSVELIDDLRLAKSILSVTNDLQAVETPEGHGDAFWSCGGALMGISKTFDYSRWENQFKNKKAGRT